MYVLPHNGISSNWHCNYIYMGFIYVQPKHIKKSIPVNRIQVKYFWMELLKE